MNSPCYMCDHCNQRKHCMNFCSIFEYGDWYYTYDYCDCIDNITEIASYYARTKNNLLLNEPLLQSSHAAANLRLRLGFFRSRTNTWGPCWVQWLRFDHFKSHKLGYKWHPGLKTLNLRPDNVFRLEYYYL